ncbi:MAG: hypothetical protein HOP21_08535, partial [Methylotenera sp.]|nr:hypothetical protein [Methylotenera sp.]
MQVAVAGSQIPGTGSSDYEIETGPMGDYGVDYNDGPEDGNGMVDRTFTTRYENRSSRSLKHIEKTTSRVCVSDKCNPSINNTPPSGGGASGASGTGTGTNTTGGDNCPTGPGTCANDQAIQQIILQSGTITNQVVTG